MRIRLFTFILSILLPSLLLAQKYTLSGTITESETGDPLFGVNVLVDNSGVISDFDGIYSIDLKPGIYTITFSYIGFSDIIETVEITNQPETLDIIMGGSAVLNEVTVTADIAIDRETPVAFTNIPTIKIEEELASQDLPLLLNSTPGAYATNSGGGDGDARVSIRGFDQRNIAVMLDGIPVNDMENGRVFWSNWFGLDLVTQTMQVQRGLGASKLALPSLGGTINILTQGIESKRKLSARQEYGSGNFLRTILGYNSGRLESGWGFSLAGSYKTGDGWVDQAWTEAYFYYVRIDKQFERHMLSFSAFGAPQKHGQRAFTSEIAQVDTTLAIDLGVDPELFPQFVDQGRRYNEFWGFLDRYEISEDGDTTRLGVESLNTRQNFYHKPQISLRHSWNISQKLFLSNNAYVSIGRGGGVNPEDGFPVISDPEAIDYAQLNIQNVFDRNITTDFSKPERNSENILRASINNHMWYGLLSTFQYDLNENIDISGGLDLRYYEGDHYREVYDLLGGDYYTNQTNRLADPETQLVEGDRFGYFDTGFVRWAGVFGLAEYTKNKWSAFVNFSAATIGYASEAYFKDKVINLPDTTLFVGFNRPAELNGTTYTVDSPEAEFQRVGWLSKNSITFKTGANYRFNRNHNAFVNVGYLSRPTRFNNVIDNNRFIEDAPVVAIEQSQNEIVYALELGYGFKSPKFSGNVNGYYMNWENRPLDITPLANEDPSDFESDQFQININGVAARHMGIEMDFAYRQSRMLTLEGLLSIGDWIWNSRVDEFTGFDVQRDPITDEIISVDSTFFQFDATGVHVGDQPQIQYGGLVRFSPVKGLYFKLKGTFFAKHFANFNPESLDLEGENARRESWKAPNYFLMDFHSGYNFRVNDVRMGFRFNILNLLDTVYIGDARNNDRFSVFQTDNFDAQSASVFFGQGIRFNTSFQVTF
ncbi:MAG: carboxypeptidase-like regulatory domain-containing protein [Bacteroidota bacterium]